MASHAISNCNLAGASITVRDLDHRLMMRLRMQAAVHGCSMEDEARNILGAAVNREPVRLGSLAASIRARFACLGGVELPPVPRAAMRAPQPSAHDPPARLEVCR
jgi:plasmid stability protein